MPFRRHRIYYTLLTRQYVALSVSCLHSFILIQVKKKLDGRVVKRFLSELDGRFTKFGANGLTWMGKSRAKRGSNTFAV